MVSSLFDFVITLILSKLSQHASGMREIHQEDNKTSYELVSIDQEDQSSIYRYDSEWPEIDLNLPCPSSWQNQTALVQIYYIPPWRQLVDKDGKPDERNSKTCYLTIGGSTCAPKSDTRLQYRVANDGCPQECRDANGGCVVEYPLDTTLRGQCVCRYYSIRDTGRFVVVVVQTMLSIITMVVAKFADVGLLWSVQGSVAGTTQTRRAISCYFVAFITSISSLIIWTLTAQYIKDSNWVVAGALPAAVMVLFTNEMSRWLEAFTPMFPKISPMLQHSHVENGSGAAALRPIAIAAVILGVVGLQVPSEDRPSMWSMPSNPTDTNNAALGGTKYHRFLEQSGARYGQVGGLPGAV